MTNLIDNTYIIRIEKSAKSILAYGRGKKMKRKLTLTVDEEVYNGLRSVIGPRKISHFIEDLVRPHVVKRDIYAAYAQMAAEKEREYEAEDWAEGTFGDSYNDAR